MAEQLTQEEYLERLNRKWGHKNYDLSLVKYTLARDKIIVGCSKHGFFETTAGGFMSLGRCKKCGDEKHNDYCKKQIKTKEYMLNKISSKLKNKYDYSKFIYKRNDIKGIVICPKEGHGEWLTKPDNLYHGHGCPICGLGYTQKEWIELAIQKHDNIFDYSKTDYKNSTCKVIIICKKHGEFEQRANNHIRGDGCPYCVSQISIPETQWLDSLGIDKTNRQYRIGNYKVDGYDPITNTVYEFYGDYFHCNPKIYSVYYENKTTHKAAFEHWLLDQHREKQIKDKGFNFVKIWESEWINN